MSDGVRTGDSVTGVEGDSVELTCWVGGYQGDQSDITWTRAGGDDHPLQNSTKYTFTYQTSGPFITVTLMINNLNSGDGGEYICHAGGEQASQSVSVITSLTPSGMMGQ